MEDYRDSESYLRAELIYAKEEYKQPQLVIVSIDPMYSGQEVKAYRFRVDWTVIHISTPERLFDGMQLVKKRYNEDGKAVLFA